MKGKKPVELLAPHARANPTLDSAKAEAMFRKFMSGEFAYDEISNRPDSPAYASAEVLATILPLMIDEMLARDDMENFLIYPMLAAVDPEEEGQNWKAERTQELTKLVDHEAVEKILKLVAAARVDPPIPMDELDRIAAFWNSKLGSRSPPA